MKTRNLIFSALGLVALALAVAPIQQVYAQKPAPKITKWEYTFMQWKATPFGIQEDETIKVANDLGNQGWEMVSHDSTLGCWFKRAKQ